jgi:hypothetical protein
MGNKLEDIFAFNEEKGIDVIHFSPAVKRGNPYSMIWCFV